MDSSENNEIVFANAKKFIADTDFPTAITTIKTKRVGIKEKEDDKKKFHNELLRYVVVLPVFSGFQYKIKGIGVLIDELLKNNKITSGEAEKIVGYKRRFI